MPKPIIKIHNTETDEVIEREMNNAEYANHQKSVKESEERAALIEAEAASKAALLERLGITAEEAKLLLG
jgi:hypothetical protein